MPVGLYPYPTGVTVTEVRAIEILMGTASLISAKSPTAICRKCVTKTSTSQSSIPCPVPVSTTPSAARRECSPSFIEIISSAPVKRIYLAITFRTAEVHNGPPCFCMASRCGQCARFLLFGHFLCRGRLRHFLILDDCIHRYFGNGRNEQKGN
jgi:hypothetical protein